MTHYVHHVPGRLRIKTLTLKRNEGQAREAKQLVGRIPGALSAEVNVVTGSIVVNYDKTAVQPEHIMATLREHGFVGETGLTQGRSSPFPEPGYQPYAPVTNTVVGRVGDTILNKLVETALERSALAVIAAIL